MKRTLGPCLLGALVTVVVVPTGCRKAPPATEEPAPATSPAGGRPSAPPDPQVPAEGASPILVRPLPPGVRRDTGYVQVEKMPAGDILGLCYVPSTSDLKPPVPGPVDIDSPSDRIKDPEPKELDYYRKVDIDRARWVDDYSSDQGGHPVLNAVVMVRGVEQGPLPPLPRGKLHVNNGELHPLIAFSPVNDRLELRTYDYFSSHVVIRDADSGRMVLDKPLAGNTASFRGHGALDKQHLQAWNWTQWKRLARPIQTEVIREQGFFEIRCRRHPWQRAYAVVFDSPYLAVSGEGRRASGIFRIQKVPAGTWTVAAWHPVLEPVEPTRTVQVKPDETLELRIAFKPPPGGASPAAAKARGP